MRSLTRPTVPTTTWPPARSWALLAADRRAAEHRHHVHALALAVGAQRLGDLDAELTGRREHESLDVALVGIDVLEHGQPERRRLARARLRLADHIQALEQRRDRLLLDGTRRVVADVLERREDVVGEAELGKRGHQPPDDSPTAAVQGIRGVIGGLFLAVRGARGRSLTADTSVAKLRFRTFRNLAICDDNPGYGLFFYFFRLQPHRRLCVAHQRRGGPGLDHVDPRHHDRQRRARHPFARPSRHDRQDPVGRDRLPARARRGHPGHRLGRPPLRRQAGLPDLPDPLHARLGPVRPRHLDHGADLLPRAPGHRRRHDPARRPADDGRGRRPQAHGPRHERRRRPGDARPDPRPHHRRPDPRERLLALDLLRQRSDRHHRRHRRGCASCPRWPASRPRPWTTRAWP